ncbi:MAG: site-2 protease family protein [Desulfobacterales bacterium]|nr:site-2 protease family protein [Desulfobacterales bacterium]MDP4856366.1 site-2 protease family protein [Desulfobacterales bacterium]
MIEKIVIIAFLVESIVLHEMAHGFVALLFGDHTAERQGRITLNPIPHIDPLWTIAIPVVAYFISGGTFVIGGAKPVPINPSNYRRPILGDICVSAAGIAVNFLIAVIMILLLNIVHIVSGNLTGSITATVFLRVALLNIVLAMFNLIPIPPLDGSHLFKYLLPFGLRGPYEKLGRTGAGFIILILVINIPGLWNIFRTSFYWVGDFLLVNLVFL